MSAQAPGRVATLRGAPDRLTFHSTGRFLALLGFLFLAHLLVEPHVAFGAVAPDFYLIALVFAALRWGGLAGALLGFVLGLNLDAMQVDYFGMHALALTVTGFGLGKMKESLYLDWPALDVLLLFAAGMLTGLIVVAVGHHDDLALFEDRFFYEVPLSALYTALVGGLLFRVLKD